MEEKMIVLDSNLLIATLQGHTPTLALINRIIQTDDLAISIISYTEILTGTKPNELAKLTATLEDLSLLPFDDAETAKLAAKYRKQGNLKLPDAIILATCAYGSHLFYTYDRDFTKMKFKWIKVLEYST